MIVKDPSCVNRKSTVKNRLLKIDLQKSILYWMHTPITFCLNFVANGVPYYTTWFDAGDGARV